MKFISKYILGAIIGGALGALVLNLLNNVVFWKGFLAIALITAFISNPIALWITKRNSGSKANH